MNENRSVFALNGVTGMLIATLLLLSILAVLTYFGIMLQKDVASKPYAIKDQQSIQMISKQNASHIVIKE
ncbi:DUF4006 family protein [Campylobacter sp. 19-13652]|uniref:DUF4006 family protein n=1 Tax=Campylobacter sp. 19-13652 TaxID=2840180 RepID=UPI001C776FE5|nr:DUF4006 family protein [Campylobacter sp. 19-13652]BCX80092.1 hypothetical protein LBC_15540 [Campylobacter sp. 19-13652]